MKIKKIFTLIPERVQFDQFWIEIRRRNKWLIRLRYGAFLLISGLIFIISILQGIIPNFYVNNAPLWLVSFSILTYNLIFHWIWNKLSKKRNWSDEKRSMFSLQQREYKFRSVHFALIQICTDFIALMLFIYYTGGVETPLYVFFIFHVIIGSLFLPGSIMFLIITATLAITLTGAILELNSIIPHHPIGGWLPYNLYTNEAYIIIFFTLFGISLYLSIYLANSIARQLYMRERSLTMAYSQLEEAEKAKSRYVMSIVHDLKTPIAAVMTYLNMLLDGSLGNMREEHKKPLERSKSRLSHAIQTINDILYISQLKLQESMHEVSNFNIVELFEELYTDFRVLIRDKKLNYTLSYNPDRNILINGDRKLLKLGISNIISNACKYTSDKGTIEIVIDELETYVNISITDSGIGIPEGEQNKIFNDFYRSTLTKKLGIEGSGLGLSIALEVFKKFNGKISVVSPSYLKISDDMPGTQFIIEIPKAG